MHALSVCDASLTQALRHIGFGDLLYHYLGAEYTNWRCLLYSALTRRYMRVYYYIEDTSSLKLLPVLLTGRAFEFINRLLYAITH